MPKRRDVKAPEKVDIQMTPMIDIVFQLMAFFLMTFKVAAVEGDFNMKLPKDERSAGPSNTQSEMITIVMRASPDGDLRQLEYQGKVRGNGPDARPYMLLRSDIDKTVGAARGAGQEEPEIEIDADDNLRYEHIINVVAAVSSKYEGGEVVQLAKKVKFKPKAPQ